MTEVVNISSRGLGGRKLLRRRTLRMLVPIGFVVVIFAALVSITAYSYHSNLKDSLALSRDLLEAIEQRIAKELEAFLTPIEDTLRLAEAVLENAPFDIGNRPQLEPLAFSVLRNLAQISAFNVADTRGNFLMVKKTGDGSLHTKIVDRAQNATQVTWIRRDRSDKTLEVQKTIDDSFDPRNRPWYLGAVESRQVYWTDFYVFFSDRKYGITVSLPLIQTQDRLVGVLGLDIELEEISKFVQTLKIGRNGRAVIIAEDGRIVAHPEFEKMLISEGAKYRALRVDESKDPVLQRAYSRFQIEGHGSRNLVIDDRRYLTSAFSFSTKIGRELTVFILVPEDDFIGFIDRNNRNVLLMSIGVLALTSLMAGLMVFQGLRADRSAQLVLARQNELEAQSNAFTELSSQAALFDPADPESLSRLTEIVAKSIGVRRTSVWQFDDGAETMRCIDCYDRESDGHTQGTVLTSTGLNRLFDLLQKPEDIRAPYAGDDERLHDLYHAYLQPLGCDSLLAVPIRYRDLIAGWLWFEHERMSRDWSSEEISFARAIANMLALRFASEPPVSSQAARDEETDASRLAPLNAKEAPAETCDCRRGPDTPKPEMRRRRAVQAPMAANGRSLPASKRLPARIVDPETIAADLFTDTSVLMLRFTDPEFLARRPADGASVNAFDHLVNDLEDLVASMGIEYMRVMGDEIVCAAGMGDKTRDHCRRMAELALRLQDRCIDMFETLNLPLEFRIGIDTGAVLGSSVGKGRNAYNIWGEAVRFASMMAKTGIPGSIQVSESTYRCIRSGYLFKARGKFYLPGIGEIATYLLTG